MVQFAIDPDSFVVDDEEGNYEGEELTEEMKNASEEEIIVIAGLTKEEQNGVMEYVNDLLQSRPRPTEKEDGE
jgi:hypothetical protein